MVIKVLGPGCMNCKTLERRTHEAVEGMTPAPVIEKVEDYQQIASFGIMFIGTALAGSAFTTSPGGARWK